MAAAIRPFDPLRDAGAVADFYNLNRYGPKTRGFPLDGEMLIAVLLERGVRLFLVAERAGRIVGTIGYSQMSGRRVAESQALFAGLFLIDPTHRSGLLAGELFKASFKELVTLGIRTLRVEVDPLNRRAFPVYVRVGFRLVGPARPDHYGYVEMVSHLPGVAADLITVLGESSDLRGALPSLDWRALVGSGRHDERSGVRTDEGRPVIDYDFKIASTRATATVDVEFGTIDRVTVDGVVDARFQKRALLPAPLDTAWPTLSQGAFRVTVDPHDGTLHVTHPDVLGPVLVERFPVTGDAPTGLRRQPRRHVRSIVIGERIVSEGDGVRRDVTLEASRLAIGISSESVVTRVSLSVLPRASRLHVLSEGFDHSAHQVTGLWPVELTDFEAVADRVSLWTLAHTTATWKSASGVRVALTGDGPTSMRIEGPGLLLRTSGNLEHEFALVSERSRPATTTSSDDLASTAMAWLPARRGGKAVLAGESSEHRVVATRDNGVIRWQCGNDVVFDSSHPSTRRLGPLDGISAGLWASVQKRREDIDSGPEWIPPTASFPLETSITPRGWTVEGGPSTLVLKASSDLAEDDEIVFWFAPLGRPPFIDFTDIDGTLLRLATDNVEWRTWTDRVIVPTAEGRITIRSVSGGHPEILVRSTGTAVVLAMFCRNDGLRSSAADWVMSYSSDGAKT